MKKKLLALALINSVALCPITVLAENSETIETGEGGNTDIPVTVNVSKEASGDSGQKDYFIEIDWNMTSGNYALDGDVYKWDAKNKKYVKNTNENSSLKKVNDATCSITITNQSNDAIDYSINYQSGKGIKSSEKTASGVKTGTLNAMVDGTEIDNSGANEITTSKEPTTAIYTGNIILSEYSSAIESLTIGNYKVNVKKHTI